MTFDRSKYCPGCQLIVAPGDPRRVVSVDGQEGHAGHFSPRQYYDRAQVRSIDPSALSAIIKKNNKSNGAMAS